MPEKQYLILLDIDARKRHHHVTEAGRIAKFVVQLEVKTGVVWKEVIRYDVHMIMHIKIVIILKNNAGK